MNVGTGMNALAGTLAWQFVSADCVWLLGCFWNGFCWLQCCVVDLCVAGWCLCDCVHVGEGQFMYRRYVGRLMLRVCLCAGRVRGGVSCCSWALVLLFVVDLCLVWFVHVYLYLVV